MKKALKTIIISLIISCITLMPFSVLAEEYIDYEIPYESSGAYAYFSYHGMELIYNTGNYEKSYQCATWTDSSHTSCMVWKEYTNSAHILHDTFYNNMGYMKGSYRSITSNTWDGAGYLLPGEEFILAFASPRGTFVNNPNIQMYRVDSGGVDTTCNITVKSRFNGTDRLYLFIIVSTQGGSYHINLTDFNNVSGPIKPYYFGYKKYMTNDMSQFLFGESNALEVSDTQTHDLISNGNTASQQSVSALDQSNQSLTTGFNNMSSAESQYNQDFNTQLNLIDFSDQLGTQQGFISSAGFLVQTFNALIANNFLSILIIIICILFVFKRFV